MGIFVCHLTNAGELRTTQNPCTYQYFVHAEETTHLSYSRHAHLMIYIYTPEYIGTYVATLSQTLFIYVYFLSQRGCK